MASLCRDELEYFIDLAMNESQRWLEVRVLAQRDLKQGQTAWHPHPECLFTLYQIAYLFPFMSSKRGCGLFSSTFSNEYIVAQPSLGSDASLIIAPPVKGKGNGGE